MVLLFFLTVTNFKLLFRGSEQTSHSSYLQADVETIPQHFALPDSLRLHPAVHAGLVLGTARQGSVTAIITDWEISCNYHLKRKIMLDDAKTLELGCFYCTFDCFHLLFL